MFVRLKVRHVTEYEIHCLAECAPCSPLLCTASVLLSNLGDSRMDTALYCILRKISGTYHCDMFPGEHLHTIHLYWYIATRLLSVTLLPTCAQNDAAAGAHGMFA